MTNPIKYWAIIFLTIAILIGVFVFLPPIPQWPSYHQFADTHMILGIPNFWNVISNVLFCFVSVIGFYHLQQKWREKIINKKEWIVFFSIFIGIFLIGIGSAYYHWTPNNATLIWDRIPITIVFMALMSLTIMERINFNVGFWLLAPLIIFGIGSVWYWHWTELQGQGDLRLYGFVQFYSIFLIIAILYLFPKNYPPLKAYIWMFVFYGIAKAFETFDASIYGIGELLSGHTLKHIAAAISTYGIVIMLKNKH